MNKIIFRDFNHWFSTSKEHGMTSFSRDWMERIWNEIYPTIKASQGDYKKAYLELMKETAENNCELTSLMLEYISEFRQQGQPGFWRWWSKKQDKEFQD